MSGDRVQIRVLCVDDHPIVRQGIATLLSVEPDMVLVAEATNGREALEQFRAHVPDVTLMDLQMPGMGGIDAIDAIRAQFPQARIIVLTTYAGDAQAQRALQAGARGYLLKNALHKELLDAIRAVHAGRIALPSEGSFELAGQVKDEVITQAEVSLLKFIAERNVYAEIAKALGQTEDAVVDQVRGILSKLQDRDLEPAVGDDGAQGLIEAERAARHAAEAANRAKSQFLTGMSHELRTPLNAILGYAQLLSMEGGLSPRQVRGLDTIHQSGQHLLALINDILDLARIEAGRTDLNPEPVQLAELLQAVVNLMRVKADEKHLSFVFDAGAGLPDTVLADERRLRQVLLNLLSNAIKFTDAGTVTLRAAAEPAGPAQALLRLEVEDTGVGMRPDDLARLFKPFEQVGDVQRRSGGTGLGLAITRALVIDMGGRVQVSSEFGSGTRFSVELPLPVTQPAAATPPGVPALARYQGESRRVLVVDDVAANRELMCDFLTQVGFEVALASDGGDMLEIARTFRPDLILMDSVMPSLDGVEATRQLRRDADLARVPVIAISAAVTAEHRAASLQSGVNVFLTKPVSLQELQSHIGEQLGLKWVAPGESGSMTSPPTESR
ncbi:signal transduction histidine kinase [Pelomonas saccharophila]|uniref:histidine kinase n=1 Tax=Roseateles saccharophilus TaxID=304 RepID=A0ABU1YST3_ROSSA|nr:response regulator [Roseateles saccharophilus]MDR7271920.1 signal transduction histidine kinase [Roseateles saccharophilus]